MVTVICLKCGNELREIEQKYEAELSIKHHDKEWKIPLNDTVIFECPKCKFKICLDLSDRWKE